MDSLPDEIWSQILCVSTKGEGGLGAWDLCCLAIVSKRFRRISSECNVWRPLVERDFSSEGKRAEEFEVNAKTLYRTKYEKKRAKREAERRRQVMGLQSGIQTSILRMIKFEKKLENEKAAAAEIRQRLSALHTSSRASVALQRWQPQAVRTHHHWVMQQVPVDSAAEVNSLTLELQERLHFIVTCENALESLEKTIKTLQDRLFQLYHNPIEGTSSPNGKFGRKSSIDWLSWRRPKRAKTMNQ